MRGTTASLSHTSLCRGASYGKGQLSLRASRVGVTELAASGTSQTLEC